MRRLHRLVFVALSALVACWGQVQASEPLEQSDRSILDRFRAEYRTAFVRGDVRSLSDAYAEQVRVMPEYHPTLFGRNELQQYHRAFAQRFVVREYARDSYKIWKLGSRVIEIGQFKWQLSRRADGRSQELTGKYMDVWHRSGNGVLRLHAQTWNLDRYPGDQADFRFRDVPGTRTALEAHLPVKDELTFELEALNRMQEVAISEHDERIWQQFFADDAVLLPNHGPLADGAAAITTYIEHHAKGLPVFEKLDIRHDAVDRIDDRYVIDYASHVANWRHGDASGVSTGKNIRIWRREPQGGLKLIAQIGTYD